eukprot:gene3127-3595_t
MAAKVWEVAWSPHSPDEFIRFNNEIFLYRIAREDDSLLKTTGSKTQTMKLSDNISASVVAVNSDVSSIKEISWCMRPDNPHLLAVAQSNGHVILTNIGHDVIASNSYPVGLELGLYHIPKSDRTCTDLAWNPVEHNFLAVALDKVRNDHSLLVWDVESKKASASSKAVYGRHQRLDGSVLSPAVKNGPSEPTVSLAWFPSQPRTLVAGQGQKFLRIYDLRDQSKLIGYGVTNSKAMNGVCVDPFNEHRFASFTEATQGPVLVWDMRNLKEPISFFVITVLNPPY